MAKRSSKTRRKARAAGYRSGFEQQVAEQAKSDGIHFEYEKLRVTYQGKPKTYTPDFVLKNGIIVETKGRFTSFDRTKHLRIKEQHPDLDIRFVFQYDNKLNPSSNTRYSDWCTNHGFPWAVGGIPKEWARERPRR